MRINQGKYMIFLVVRKRNVCANTLFVKSDFLSIFD